MEFVLSVDRLLQASRVEVVDEVEVVEDVEEAAKGESTYPNVEVEYCVYVGCVVLVVIYCGVLDVYCYVVDTYYGLVDVVQVVVVYCGLLVVYWVLYCVVDYDWGNELGLTVCYIQFIDDWTIFVVTVGGVVVKDWGRIMGVGDDIVDVIVGLGIDGVNVEEVAEGINVLVVEVEVVGMGGAAVVICGTKFVEYLLELILDDDVLPNELVNVLLLLETVTLGTTVGITVGATVGIKVWTTVGITGTLATTVGIPVMTGGLVITGSVSIVGTRVPVRLIAIGLELAELELPLALPRAILGLTLLTVAEGVTIVLLLPLSGWLFDGGLLGKFMLLELFRTAVWDCRFDETVFVNKLESAEGGEDEEDEDGDEDEEDETEIEAEGDEVIMTGTKVDADAVPTLFSSFTLSRGRFARNFLSQGNDLVTTLFLLAYFLFPVYYFAQLSFPLLLSFTRKLVPLPPVGLTTRVMVLLLALEEGGELGLRSIGVYTVLEVPSGFTNVTLSQYLSDILINSLFTAADRPRKPNKMNFIFLIVLSNFYTFRYIELYYF